MIEECYIQAVKRNNRRLYLIALSYTKNHYDSEDIMQNTFLKLWNCKKSFADCEHLDSWLTKVCINECKNYVKLTFHKNKILEEAMDLYSFDDVRDFDLFNAVMSLKKNERIVVHLFYFEDMSVYDISRLLTLKESTVKTRLHRARKNLKEILEDEWINE